MNQMDDVAVFIDRMQLRDLVERYACCADARDRAGFAGVFTEHGVLSTSTGRTFEGRAAIASTMDYLDSHYPRSMHFIGNHQVEFDDDGASGLTYCLAHHVYSQAGQDRDTLMVIRYRDRYERTAEGWKIGQRALTIDWQEDRPLTVG
jgi:uncharacterized protein (TIGR02246 family)